LSNEFRIGPMTHTTLIYTNNLVEWINHDPWHLLCLYMYNYFITLQMFLKKIHIGMPKWMDGKLLGQLLYKSLRLHLHKWCVGNVSKMGWNCDVPLREPWVGVHGMKRKRGNSTIVCKTTSPPINEQESKHLSSFHLLGLTTYSMKRRG
jgi:hypothetical protein